MGNWHLVDGQIDFYKHYKQIKSCLKGEYCVMWSQIQSSFGKDNIKLECGFEYWKTSFCPFYSCPSEFIVQYEIFQQPHYLFFKTNFLKIYCEINSFVGNKTLGIYDLPSRGLYDSSWMPQSVKFMAIIIELWKNQNDILVFFLKKKHSFKMIF